ncbi:LLM class flavin-dependent oxidoreductase [Nonomuraea fuscirosea]|uniref:LLM class flavin-dependent oxidoreductase n=1 Tax=Nonomuraea fuscirosea TaxID=1291556 RepID=UPI00341C3471
MIEIEVNINARTIAEAVHLAVEAEASGARQIGVWDSPAAFADCWTTLGALSQRISTIPIGVAVTNPLTRHPVVTASAIAALANTAAGGVFLGIGTGDSGVYNLGGRAATRSVLREYVICVKELLGSGRSRWHGRDVFLDQRPQVKVPLYVSAHGVKALELAAEVADGIFLGLGHSQDVVTEVLAVLSRVASEAGRDPSSIDLWWNSYAISVDADSDQAITESGWLLAHAAHHLARFGMDGKMVPAEFRDKVAELGEYYRLTHHGRHSSEHREDYIEKAIELGVWGYLRDRFLIAGNHAEVRSKLKALHSMGVRKFETGPSVRGLEGIRSVLDLVGEMNRNGVGLRPDDREESQLPGLHA